MRSRQWLWLILGVSVLLRIGASILLGNQVVPLPSIFDQVSYHTLATRVIDGYGYTFGSQWWPMTRAGEPTAHWSFLYTLYLTVIYSIFGVNPLAARLIQSVIVGLAGPWLVYRLSASVFADRNPAVSPSIVMTSVSLLAATWFALYGYFIYFSAALMTESFFIVGILWSLDSAVRMQKQGKLVNFLELGLASGLTVLLRQTFFVVIPLLLIWVAWANHRSSDKKMKVLDLGLGSLASILVISLLILPFTYQNYRRFGHFVLLNTNAGFAFFWSNHPVHGTNFAPLYTSEMPSYQEVIPPALRDLDEAAMDSELMKAGIQFILDDPRRFLLLTISRIPVHFMFWPKADSSLPSNLTRVLSIGLALPFMIAGGWFWFQDIRRNQITPSPGILIILFICIYVGLHLVSWASIRYRLPTDAVGLIFAARGLFQLLQKFVFPFNRLVRV